MQTVERRIYLHVDEQISAFLYCIEQQPEGFVLITECGPDRYRVIHGKMRRICRALQLFEHSQRLLSPAHPDIHEREIGGVDYIADIPPPLRHSFFQAGDGIRIPPHLAVDVTKATPGPVVLRIQINPPLQTPFGLFVLARAEETYAEIRLHERREWIEFFGGLNLTDRFVMTAQRRQQESKESMRLHAARIQIDGAPEIVLRPRPVPFVTVFEHGQGSVALGAVGIRCKRLGGGLTRGLFDFPKGRCPKEASL